MFRACGLPSCEARRPGGRGERRGEGEQEIREGWTPIKEATMVVLMLALLATAAAWAAPQPVSEAEVRNWLRQLLPLPKEIEIPRQATVPRDAIRLETNAMGGEPARTAQDELVALLGEGILRKSRPDDLFTIRLDGGGVALSMNLLPPGVDRLAKLPNAEQAYLIAPLSGNGIVVTALDGRGLYHGGKTLQQLLRPGLAEGMVTVPLATIRDWPDLAERGEWGGSANSDVEWFAERKMNLIETHVDMSLDEAGRGVAKVDEKLLGLGRAHALKVVPIVTHLDQLAGTGVYQRYPELKGVGESAQHKTFADEVAPCFSKPRMAELLADWFGSLASQPGVTDICVWLSEEHLQCECESCRAQGQYVLEAGAAVRAWRLAREKHPHVKLRILLTQGSYSTNDKVLAVVPPEVGITYYDGGRTYDSSRDPMIYPLLEQYAAGGRWLGCYPQLDASWRIACPWSGPQFIRYRMTEFVQKKLQCLCGYATPNNRLYDFNVQAAAEWSWNSTGRDEREFATAWATREGLKDPEKAAAWAVILGPVGWDVYGSGVPYPHFFGSAAGLVAGRGAPKLGEGMFRYFPEAMQFDRDLAACDQALALARALEAPGLIAETEAITGYVKMTRAVYELASAVAGKQTLTEEEKAQVQGLMTGLDAATLSTVEAMTAWEQSVGPGLGGSRFTDTLSVTERTSADIGQALAAFGVSDPGAPYRPRKIGGWATDEFQPNQERITKQWEVTEALSGPGRYEVRFDYTKGWWGLTMSRVALAFAPAGSPEQLTEVVADDHPGTAAYENKANTYTLGVAEHGLALRYFIVADIQGVTSEGKAENRQGCEGEVWMQKARPDERR